MAQKAIRSRGWCFTINNYTQEDIDWLNGLNAKYLIYAKEVGEKGTPHIQGFVHFKNPRRFNTVKKYHETAHWEKQIGQADACITYCKKRTTPPEDIIEIGDPPKSEGGSRPWQKVLDLIKEGKQYVDIVEECPGHALHAERAIKNLIENFANQKVLDEMKVAFAEKELRDWQKECIDKLENQNDREVLWIVDYTGNSGKTWLGKWLVAMKGAFYTTAGKKADVMHAWQRQEYVVLDLSRQKSEFMNYEMIEEFKNGMICKTKYDSKTVVAKSCKVIVFSNWDPDRTKLSQDRWNVVTLGQKPTVFCDDINHPFRFIN